MKYLLEVCDPCQAIWYPVNGVPVSDFYCRGTSIRCAGSATATASPARSGARSRSSTGGYLSWLDPGDSGLYQLGAGEHRETQVADLDRLKRSTAALRTIIDTSPITPRLDRQALRAAGTAFSASGTVAAVEEASRGAGLRVAQAVYSLASETD